MYIRYVRIERMYSNRQSLLLRSLSEAATLFLTDRVGPGRFIICELSRSDFFHGRWFWVAAVRWISGSSFRIVRARPTWSPTDLFVDQMSLLQFFQQCYHAKRNFIDRWK